MKKQYGVETELLYRGTEMGSNIINPETPPIHHTTAYIIEDTKDYDFANDGGKYFYNRTANPNRDGVAEAISYLENGEDTIVCASGMAAISTTLLSLLQTGDHVLCSKAIYGETITLVETLLMGFGIAVSFADFTDPKQVEMQIQDNTKVVYAEVIANPLTEVVCVPEIANITKKHKALFVVDSTFTTPFAIKPLDFGADVVIHSLTKYFGGHSDVTGGSITANKEIINIIKPKFLCLGGCMDPNSAWLMQRSLKTMSMRVKTQFQNAVEVAKALNGCEMVEKVHHPSLKSHPQHELAKELFCGQYGAMLSFRVEDDLELVDAFIRKLELVKYLGTLGGMRTTLAHPATAFRHEFTKEQLETMGIYDGLIRISVGTEDAEDIIADLLQALEVFS